VIFKYTTFLYSNTNANTHVNPSLATAVREPSQLWNTQWNALVTEQELKLSFLQMWRWRSTDQVSHGRKNI
jgi:hypothetical protein